MVVLECLSPPGTPVVGLWALVPATPGTKWQVGGGSLSVPPAAAPHPPRDSVSPPLPATNRFRCKLAGEHSGDYGCGGVADD